MARVLEGKTDALLGAAGDQSVIMEDRGFEVVTLKFADYGVNILNLGIFVHRDTVEDDPDLIRRFLRATKRSHEALAENYDQAMQLLLDLKTARSCQSTVVRKASTGRCLLRASMES